MDAIIERRHTNGTLWYSKTACQAQTAPNIFQKNKTDGSSRFHGESGSLQLLSGQNLGPAAKAGAHHHQ